MNIEGEFKHKLFSAFLEYLNRADDVDGFVDLVELPLLEAIMNYVDGDVLRAYEILGCLKSGISNRLENEFDIAKGRRRKGFSRSEKRRHWLKK